MPMIYVGDCRRRRRRRVWCSEIEVRLEGPCCFPSNGLLMFQSLLPPNFPIFKHHHKFISCRTFFSSNTMASASLEDRFDQINIHDDHENGATSYHKSKVRHEH